MSRPRRATTTTTTTTKAKRKAVPSRPMKKATQSPERSRSLRARLEEAEATLDAIRGGSVDALVVLSPDGGERIFTLQGADHSYRRLIETMREGAATMSADGIILYCNAHLAEMLGVPLERTIGSALRSSVSRQSLARFDTIVANGRIRPSAGEVQLETPRGTIPTFISATPSGDDGPDVSCVVVTDLTEQRRNEELVAAEQRIRFLADSMPQIVWAASPDGCIDYFNSRWFEYTGFADKTSELEAALHPDDVEMSRQRWAECVRSGAPFEVQYRVRRRDDVYRWHLGRALPQRNDEGEILRWFGTCTDIDDQKRAEELAEEANRLKDEFLMTVSHELRTPLTSILGWARMLRKPHLDPPTREKGLDTLERCAKAQSQLIDDLLDVSRVMSGKMRLEVAPQALDAVVKAAVDAARPAADAKGVRLEFELVGPPVYVRGDAVRLQQVAWNLLSNAIKFTPRGGRVRATLERDGTMAELSVNDDGAGIAREFLPYVFDRFRQADSSTTRSKAGLGLGLSIVRHLTELHGGTVEVHSDGIGKGATFRIRLPVARDMSELETVTASSSRDGQRASDEVLEVDLTGIAVLVIDDEANTRDLLATVLADRGANVETAASAADGLAAVKENPPQVIVSDIGMPTEDGYSFIRRVRALPPAAGGLVPAVALTAYTRPQDRDLALDAGFQRHLGKPVEPAELASVVARLASMKTSRPT